MAATHQIAYREGTDKDLIYREFIRRGKNAAIRLGLKLGRPMTSLSSWTSFWTNHPRVKSYEELRARRGGARGSHAKAAVEIPDEELPSAEELNAHSARVNVTVLLSKWSVEFFKREARKRGVPYQKIIQALVDAYADRNTKRRA